MSNEAAQPAPQPEPAHEVDRIRDIIFGGAMRDYEQRFQTVHGELQRLQKEIDQLGSQLATQDSEQNAKLQALRQETHKAAESLEAALRKAIKELDVAKADRTVLGDLLIQMGSQLKAQPK
jgi:Skp family chaperone for outer membrane proteins